MIVCSETRSRARRQASTRRFRPTPDLPPTHRCPKSGPSRRAGASAKFPAQVVLGVLLSWAFENFPCRTVLNLVSGTPALRRIDVEECGHVSDSLRLLEVMSHDRDGVVLLQFFHQFFDLVRRDR